MRSPDHRPAGPGRHRAPGLRVVALLAAQLALAACAGAGPAEHRAEPVPPSPAPASPAPPSPAGTQAAPERLRIPAIGVDESLLRLGIAADGSAEVPRDHDRAGWFAGGPPGPTVVLGHVDSRSGPAVFHRLGELRPGEHVEVDRADGSTTRYVVDRTEQVPKAGFPTVAVFGASTSDVLRLVTCGGRFDRAAGSYTDNLVVHARRA